MHLDNYKKTKITYKLDGGSSCDGYCCIFLTPGSASELELTNAASLSEKIAKFTVFLRNLNQM
jgi:hypothetical protein